MKKPAPSDYPILPVLAERWSPLAYDSRSVEPEKLNRIFEAARWAPSCFNDQPWSFVVSHHGTEAFERMSGCLVEGNAWAKNAPVLALSVANKNSPRTGKPNPYALYDTGAAVATLIAQATAEGLLVHQMGGFDREKARAVLQIPDDHELGAMIAIGYYGDRASLSEQQRQREDGPRTRKPVKDFVFAGAWGTKSPGTK